MTQDYLKIKEWFEELLNVDNISIVYGNNMDSCENMDEYDIDRYALSRKLLYFDKSNNVLSTNSPYGTHWEKRKDVVKVKSSYNFRWIIKGDNFLPLTTQYINIEKYDGTTENIWSYSKIMDFINSCKLFGVY